MTRKKHADWMSKAPNTTFDKRRLSKHRSRDKLLAQSAISLTASVGARHHEVSSAQLRGDDSPEVAEDSVVPVDVMCTTSAKEFQCHVGRVSSSGCS